MTEFYVTQEAMNAWGPYPRENIRTLMYSIGAFDEAHSPALPRDIDDQMARRMAVTLSEKAGYYYKGHLPYCGDRVGEVARDWCPCHMEEDVVVGGITSDLLNDVRTYTEKFGFAPSRVMIVSGHGGNNFLKDRSEAISKSVALPVSYFPPFAGVKITHDRLGPIEINHADIAEHSIALYLGLLDEKQLDRINDFAARDPEGALRRWPTLAGLGGFRLYGGARYDGLRRRSYDFLNSARRFLAERKMLAEYELGKKVWEMHIDSLLTAFNSS